MHDIVGNILGGAWNAAMPASYFTRQGVLLSMVPGTVGGGVVRGNFPGFTGKVHSSDLARRVALHRCGRMDAEFFRVPENDLESGDRLILPAAARALSNVVAEC